MAEGTRGAEARIRTLEAEWLAAQARKDLDGMVAIYAPDARVMLPDIAPIVGRDAIRELYVRLFEARPRWRHELTIETIDVAASLDLAVARGTYRTTFDAERPEEYDAWKFVDVWRFVDGDWRQAISVANRDPRTA